MNTIWTVGHSTHPIGHFIEMLVSFNVKMLADVRTYPGSARHPQFNRQPLMAALQEKGIGYHHLPALGGKGIMGTGELSPSGKPINSYGVYMQTHAFKEAVGILEGMAIDKRLVYMCAEANWAQCHRSYISLYLKANGWNVNHITGISKFVAHPDPSPVIVQGKLF